MMPLAPERSTMCVPAKPKADFSIDFIVGNAKKSSSKNSSSNNNNNNSPPRSPLSGRQASPPHRSSGTPDSVQDEDEEVRARLLGLQAAQAASLPGAGALHGLLHHPLAGGPLGGPLPLGGLPLGLPRGGPPSPGSPSPPSSPPQQQFLFRSLYRPEPMLMPPQLHLQPHMAHLHHHPGHPAHPGHPGHPGHQAHPGPPKDSYPLYPWLLSRHGRIFPHRFPGVGGPDFAGFLLHPFRKPKRIRTAFSPSQLLKLEHAFENNHYVVGAERKQVAQALGLSETQVKVWFQNRRTKHKRTEQEEEAKQRKDSSSGNNNNNNSSSSSHQQQDDERVLSHRPVDLSSHDDSSDMESES